MTFFFLMSISLVTRLVGSYAMPKGRKEESAGKKCCRGKNDEEKHASSATVKMVSLVSRGPESASTKKIENVSRTDSLTLTSRENTTQIR